MADDGHPRTGQFMGNGTASTECKASWRAGAIHGALQRIDGNTFTPPGLLLMLPNV